MNQLPAAAAIACCAATLHAVPTQIVEETFDNPAGDAPLSNYGWSVLVTEVSSITNYGGQSRAIGVGSADYGFYAPKADDNTALWTGAVPNDPAIAGTPLPMAVDIGDLISVKWDSSADNDDHEFRVAVQVGGSWYASSVSLNDAFPDSGTAPANFVALEYAPASFATASNWLMVQNATESATAPLSLGIAPASDLAGEVTAVGFYLVSGTDNEVAGDHVRFDNFIITADAPEPPAQVYLETFENPGAEAPLSDFGWSVLVTENGAISAYSPESKAIGVSNLDYAFLAAKQDDGEPFLDAVPNVPALATTTAAGSIDLSALDSIRWLASGDNIDHEYRVAIEVGGVWYASDLVLNDGIADSGIGTFSLLTFSPESFGTASNWRTIENTTIGATSPLALGSSPVSDLTGPVTGFGLYLVPGTDDEVAGDHVRFDDFEILATLPESQDAPKISAFTEVGAGVWEVELKGAAVTAYQFYESDDLNFALGTLVSSLSQANPGTDPGTLTDGNLLTTDANGDGRVRLLLSEGSRAFVRAEEAP